MISQTEQQEEKKVAWKRKGKASGKTLSHSFLRPASAIAESSVNQCSAIKDANFEHCDNRSCTSTQLSEAMSSSSSEENLVKFIVHSSDDSDYEFEESNIRFINWLLDDDSDYFHTPTGPSLGKSLMFHRKREVEPLAVFNLFSNFGNIESIAIVHNVVHVKFRQASGQVELLEGLNRQMFEGEPLLLEIDEKSELRIEGVKGYYIQYSPDFDRIQPETILCKATNSVLITLLGECFTEHWQGIYRTLGMYEGLLELNVLTSDNSGIMLKATYQTISSAISTIANLNNTRKYNLRWILCFTQ